MSSSLYLWVLRYSVALIGSHAVCFDMANELNVSVVVLAFNFFLVQGSAPKVRSPSNASALAVFNPNAEKPFIAQSIGYCIGQLFYGGTASVGEIVYAFDD